MGRVGLVAALRTGVLPIERRADHVTFDRRSRASYLTVKVVEAVVDPLVAVTWYVPTGSFARSRN